MNLQPTDGGTPSRRTASLCREPLFASIAQAITLGTSADAMELMRRASIMPRIKIETRWLIIAQSPGEPVTPGYYRAVRAAFVRAWAQARRGEINSGLTFYEHVAALGQMLACLIQARRDRRPA